MKLKLFFLASAAAIVAAQSASAADILDAAEPVDYVRVCDAFGSGYFYLPGTETCLRISGYVRFDTLFDDSKDYHYDFKLRARLNIDAKSETDLGTLQGFIRFQSDQSAGIGTDFTTTIERTYITLGGFFAGYDSSFYDYSVGDGGFTLERRGFRSDTVIDHIGYRYAPKTGLGWFISAEDSRDTSTNFYYPDLVGGITYTGDTFDVKFSGVGADNFGGYAFQAAGTVKLDSIAKGDAFRVIFALADNASTKFTGTGGSRGFVSEQITDSWSILGSFRHYWKPEFVTAVTATYGEADGETGYEGIVSANYSPAKGMWVGPELSYLNDDNGSDASSDRWLGMLRFLREF